MIIQAAYEGPPFAETPCTSCARTPLGAAPGTTNTWVLILAALAVGAAGLTLYSFNGRKKPLSGRKGLRGAKHPATAADFRRWTDKAKSMSVTELHYALLDAKRAAQAMRSHDPVAENWYRDEAMTYQDEFRRRRAR